MNQELLDDELSFQLNNKINKCNKEELFKYNKEQYENTKTIISELFGWFKQINRNCFLCSQTTYGFIFDFYFGYHRSRNCSLYVLSEPCRWNHITLFLAGLNHVYGLSFDERSLPSD